MPRVRKTERGPKETVSAPPFTFATMHALLRDKVMKKGKMPDTTAIAHLTHVSNLLQFQCRGAAIGQAGNVAAWATIWVNTGIAPGQSRDRPELAGLGRWAM